MKLKKLIEEGFYPKNDLNCAETILYGANRVYNLGLPVSYLRLCAGFGGGMGIENVCGAVTASVMVLSYLFVKDRCHLSPEIKEINRELFHLYERELGDYNCKILKEKYCKEEKKCFDVILKGAEILDFMIEKENEKRGKNEPHQTIGDYRGGAGRNYGCHNCS